MRTAKALSISASISTRFWRRVDSNGPVHPTLGTRCQLWTGPLNPKGYGTIGVSIGHGKARKELVHRVAAVLRDGPLQAGELVLHLFGCSSRACVLHTYRGTQKQKMIDRAATGYRPGRNAPKGPDHWTRRGEMPRDAKGRNLPKAKATALLRREVFARAAGKCEACCKPLGDSGQMDHQWGRAKAPQSASNCWALCLPCHDGKTNNRPAAAFWIRRFQVHCRKYGFTVELSRADARLAVLAQKGFAA
jgi:5-methylcytosine-specific restriction endonuclease McrA